MELNLSFKSNESLAENKIKNESGNDIHEHEKQQNEWTGQIHSEIVTKFRLKKFE